MSLVRRAGIGVHSPKKQSKATCSGCVACGFGKVLIELDGQQHTGKSYHGESVQERSAKDAAVDAAAIAEGWWLIRITPGQDKWMAKAKRAILDVAYEVKYGGSPRLITVDC